MDAENLLYELPDLAVSTGSACSTMAGEPSHVLKAMGRSAVETAATFRLGIGRTTTEAEARYAAAQIITAYRRLTAGNETAEILGKTIQHNRVS